MEIDRRDVLTGLAASAAAVGLPAMTAPEEPSSLMRTGSICELDRHMHFLMRFVHPAGYAQGTPFECYDACPRRWLDHEQSPVCPGFLRVAKPHPAVPLAEPAVPVDKFGRALPA